MTVGSVDDPILNPLQPVSKRSGSIKEILPDLHKEYPFASRRELRQIATLYTRRDKAKEAPSLKSLQQLWQGQILKS